MPGPGPCVCPQGGLISGLCRQRSAVDQGHLPCVGGERPHLLLCNPDLAREGPFVALSSASLGPRGHEEPGIVFIPLGDKN